MSDHIDDSEPHGAPTQRDETEDDFDLLTYNEAGARLAEEIDRLTRQLAEYERRPRTEAAAREAEASRTRLAALREAQLRIGGRALNGKNFERFFGYPPSEATSRLRKE